ncbi:MAG: hypothetical protein ACYCOU_01795 [Sulfobacillus sp.]
MPRKIPKPLSPGEEAMAQHLRAHTIAFEREYKFNADRNYRFDFFIRPNIGIEVEGGIWNSGAHVRGSHFESDARKYNLAAKSGFIVLRYSTAMVRSGEAIADVLSILAG